MLSRLVNLLGNEVETRVFASLGCVVWNGPFLAQSHWRRSDELQPSRGTEGIVKAAMEVEVFSFFF